jgi:hypothetical protein
MSNRLKWMLVLGVSVVALGAAAVTGVSAWQSYQARQSLPSAVLTSEHTAWDAGDRIVFRNTAMGQGYGLVASVPLSEPGGARSLSSTACDRVAADADRFMCLHIERGVVPDYSATLRANNGSVVAHWPLPGIPSRTRFSPDGTLVATTAFVTGHSYATTGFSTQTEIRTADGRSLGDLEDWALFVDGAPSAPADRNYWGVTFVDEERFYATVGMTTSGLTYLVRGDIASRTLTSVARDVECPSLSPDGLRIAFKRVTSGAGPTVHWMPAIMDLATGDVRLLPEDRNVDDQLAWLDDATVMYGMPRTDAAGDSDVWTLASDGSGRPRLLIEHAWSPSVVRG